MRGGDWHKNRIRIVGIASVLLALLVYLLWPSGAPRPEPGKVYFIELIYEQGFIPFSDDEPLGPSHDAGLAGYVFEEGRLSPARGSPLPESPSVLVGRHLQLRHPLHHVTYRTIGDISEGFDRWPADREPVPAGLEHPLAWVRVPALIEVDPREDHVRVRVGDERMTVAVHGSATIWEGVLPIPFDEYLAAIREAGPALPDPDDATLQYMRELTGASESGTVTLYARVTARFHGPVELDLEDLLSLRADAYAHAAAGRLEEAAAAFTRYLDRHPDDGGAQACLERLQAGLASGVRYFRLAGTAPSGGWIGVRAPDDPGYQYRAAGDIVDGAFEFRLPAGPYRVEWFAADGHTDDAEVTLDQDREVTFASP